MDSRDTDATGPLPRGWEYSPAPSWPDLPDGLRDRMLIAVGHATVCWDDDGVLDTEQAIEVARCLAWEISRAYSEKEQT